MQRNYSALVTLAVRCPIRQQSVNMVQSKSTKATVSITCGREHKNVLMIQTRAMSLSGVLELHKKKRSSNKVLAAIEDSKYNPVDSRSGKVDRWRTQRLVVFMVFANLVILLVAQHIAPEEMKKVIDEEESIVIGSYKFWSGAASSKEKESKEDAKQETKDYKSPLRDK